MRGQALVPLTGPLLWDGLHKAPLKLADAGVMLQDVLVGLVEILQGAGRDDAQRGGERMQGGGRQEICRVRTGINKSKR